MTTLSKAGICNAVGLPLALSLLATVLGQIACRFPEDRGQTAPMSDDAKAFYTLGAMMGSKLTALKLGEPDINALSAGLQDAAAGRSPQVPTEAFASRVDELLRRRMEAVAEPERRKGDEYLIRAATAPGAKKTTSGAMLIPLQNGKGERPNPGDVVTVHYRGMLLDGTVFDSSYDRAQPAEFALESVMKCWSEGIQEVREGGKARLVCPSDTAYGDQGLPPKIPPGAILIFEIELIQVRQTHQ